MTEREQWRNYLASTTVKELIPTDFKLISATASQTIPEVLKLLTENNILSVPIWNEAEKKFDRFVDLLDIVMMVVVLGAAKDLVDALSTREVDWKEYIEQESKIFSSEPVRELADASERNPWVSVSSVLPILSLMDMFSKDVNLHRVMVTDNDQNVIGVITQSRMIQFLQDNVDKFPTLAATNVKDIVRTTDVVSITPDKKAMDAYQLIISSQVSGVAIVNEQGELVGVISASDVRRSLESNVFTDMHLPIAMYLEKGVPELKTVASSQIPVCVAPNESLKDTLEKLVQNQIHRIFVAEEKKPTGVLSLCDIISAISQ